MRRLALPFVLALVASCGSKTQTPHDLPTLTPDPPKPEGVVETTPTTVAPRRSGTGLTPELIAAVGGRQVFIEDFGSLRLSAAERRRAQQIIADWVTAEGLVVLSPALVEDAIARGASATDASGNACGPPLDRQYSIERWVAPMGAEGAITARVDCEPQSGLERLTCTMQLEIKLFAMGTEFYSAPFDPGQPWDQELKKRLPTVTDNGGHGRYGHANNPVPLAGVPRAPGARDWYLDDDAFVEGKAASETKRCSASDRPITLMIDKADNGAVTCETAAAPRYVTEYDAKVNACMCAAAVKLEKPVAKRSYFLYRGQAPEAEVLTKNGKSISANLTGGNEYRPRGSSPWMLRESDSVASCFVARTLVTAYDEVTATLDFDKTGTVTKATIGDLKGMLKPDERACVTKKLMSIRTPCPDRFAPPGQVRVSLEIREKS